MNTLPIDAEPLSVPGFYVWATEPTSYGLSFFILRESEHSWQSFGEFLVAEILFPRAPTWRTPTVDELMPTARLRHHDRIDEQMVHVLGEVMILASIFMASLQGDIAELLAQAKALQERQERERAEARERAEKERAEYAERQRRYAALQAARTTHLFEMLKWQLGEKIKLTRDGKRATVFGTIDSVWERGMHITTEKNKPMDITLRDINRLWIKHGDSRRYDVIYKTGDEPIPEEVKNDA